jgi:hypothetical protein
MADSDLCQHLDAVAAKRSHAIHPSAPGCKECLASGDTWVHLRLCMTCGHVGCCDSSRNRHATRHFHLTGHPVIKSFEPGEEWAWCYEDEEMVDNIPHFPEESPHHHLSSPTEAP